MLKYYKLSEGTTGRIIASFAREQPQIDGLVHLEEPQFEPAIWTGTEWIEDVEVYGKGKILEAENLASKKWLLSSKAVTSIESQFDVFRNSSSAWESFSDVNQAYDNFVSFLNIREPTV